MSDLWNVLPGTAFSTADEEIFAATRSNGKANPVKVYGVHFRTGQTGTPYFLLSNGSSGTIYIEGSRGEHGGRFDDFGDGVTLPKGLYLQTGSNFTSATIICELTQ